MVEILKHGYLELLRIFTVIRKQDSILASTPSKDEVVKVVGWMVGSDFNGCA